MVGQIHFASSKIKDDSAGEGDLDNVMTASAEPVIDMCRGHPGLAMKLC